VLCCAVLCYAMHCVVLCCSYVLERLAGLSTHEFEEAVLPRAQRLVCAGPLAFLRLVLSNTPQPALKLQVTRHARPCGS